MSPRSYAERHRFGRVARIPTPTPAQFGVGDINSYLLMPPQGVAAGVTLIDTGVKTPDAFEALCRGLKEHGVAIADIDRILITHAHLDHYGQAKRIRDLSGARVYASTREAELMKSFFTPSGDRREMVMRYFERWGVPRHYVERESPNAQLGRLIQDAIDVDGTLEDGDEIAVHDLRLRVVATPGHCDGHIVFHEPSLGMLFSGDHLLTDISPVPLLVFPKREDEPRPKSLVRFMQSLVRVEPFELDAVFPAHGDVIRDHRSLIAGYRLHHEKRKLQILRRLEEQPMTAWELAAKLFPKAYESQTYLVMSEVVGHLDVMADDGSIVIEERDGREIARAAQEAA